MEILYITAHYITALYLQLEIFKIYACQIMFFSIWFGIRIINAPFLQRVSLSITKTKPHVCIEAATTQVFTVVF